MLFRELYEAQVRFVWRALLRCGVAECDLPDAAQEVFVIVHRKLEEFEGRSKITTWLFAICLRVASDRRQKAHVRYELPARDLASYPASPDVNELVLSDREYAREVLQAILDRMPEPQRIVFALFELEGLSADEIAELLDISSGTVRSRLRLSRGVFRQCVARLRAGERAYGFPILKPRDV